MRISSKRAELIKNEGQTFWTTFKMVSFLLLLKVQNWRGSNTIRG